MMFVDEHSDRYAVALLLRVLDMPESTYYARVQRAEQPSDRELVDRGLLSCVYDIWVASDRGYGADRVHGQLVRDGIRVGRKRVERLMAAQGWQKAFLRRGWKGGSTVRDPDATPAPDLVNRHFTADAPDRLWVADATGIPCAEGVFWLAAVRDVRDQKRIHHFDHGSNYTAFRFAKTVKANGIAASMGTVGDSFDNALMENF